MLSMSNNTFVQIILFSLCVAINGVEYLEPIVERNARVLPVNVCQQLIELGENGTTVLLLNTIVMIVTIDTSYHIYSPVLFHPCFSIPAGFLVKEESIDEKEQSNPNKKYVPSQTIDVYRKGWSEPGLPEPKFGHAISIDNEDIWKVLEPYVPALTSLVKKNRDADEFRKYYPHDPDREPQLNWVSRDCTVTRGEI